LEILLLRGEEEKIYLEKVKHAKKKKDQPKKEIKKAKKQKDQPAIVKNAKPKSHMFFDDQDAGGKVNESGKEEESMEAEKIQNQKRKLESEIEEEMVIETKKSKGE